MDRSGTLAWLKGIGLNALNMGFSESNSSKIIAKIEDTDWILILRLGDLIRLNHLGKKI